MPTPLRVTRSQILAFRRRAGSLEQRMELGEASLRTAAWAGLQDSMPRAALLSIHARVAGTTPDAWADRSLVQIWGPRYNVFVVPARDRAVFTLALLDPNGSKARWRSDDVAARLDTFLAGRTMTYDEAGLGLGIHPNSLRYAAATGRVLIRWTGARSSLIWTIPPPDVDPADARLELARRYLNVYGPTTPDSFARWSGLARRDAVAAFDALAGELTSVRTPIGDARTLTRDEQALGEPAGPSAAARLLPSGDAYFLLYAEDRELLVPNASQRAALWTSRVWPGALLVNGDIVGTWRRANEVVSIEIWRRLTRGQREAVEAEAASLPLPGITRAISVRWS